MFCLGPMTAVGSVALTCRNSTMVSVTTDWLAGVSYLSWVLRAEAGTGMLPWIHLPWPPMVGISMGFSNPEKEDWKDGAAEAAVAAKMLALNVKREGILIASEGTSLDLEEKKRKEKRNSLVGRLNLPLYIIR